MDGLLTTSQRRLVANTWDFRASAERSALIRFRRLQGELKSADAPAVVLDLIAEAIEDEARHIGLCDMLARRFGWEGAPSRPTPSEPLGPVDASADERLLYEMVAFCCITETINASMLLAIEKRVKAPEVREVVHAILKDEVKHSKVGWAYLQHVRNQGGGTQLGRWFAVMFKEAGVEEVYTPDCGGRDASVMRDYGELSFADRTEIFRCATRDVVLPGLDHFGYATTACRAWLDRFEA
jgi:hypothetical protein